MTVNSFSQWWENITGPNSLVKEIASVIINNKSVVFDASSLIPWENDLHIAIESEVIALIAEATFDELDSDEFGDLSLTDYDIANNLMKKYGKTDVLQNYRRASKVKIQTYMIKNQVLKNHVIWVKCNKDATVSSWLNFIENYKSNGISDGLFILELKCKYNFATLMNSVIIEYEKYVTYYDQLLYNNILIANFNLHPIKKQYIALLTTLLCSNDIELSEALIERSCKSKKNTVNCLEELFEELYENSKYNGFLIDNHPFVVLKNKKREMLFNKVWEAQLKIIFPLLEEERIKFIEKHIQEIDNILKNNNILNAHGERIFEPFEAELGSLHYIFKTLTSEKGRYVISKADSDYLNLLYTFRNSIAHHKPVEMEAVNQFIETYPYSWS